jgi:hypothetical protein
MKKMTHTGILYGCDARTPDNFRQEVKLRETKLYWITESGRKYSKKDGIGVGSSFPLYRLDVKTIK